MSDGLVERSGSASGGAAQDRTARKVAISDRLRVSETLARAFHDDPLTSFFLPDENGRPPRLARMFRLLLKLAAPFEASHVTAGGEAASIWRAPGHWHIPLWQYLTNGPEMLRIFGSGAVKVMTAMDEVERRHPKTPHWYLQVIGTDPAKQGKGFGGVVMRHQFKAADAAGLACYLESSKESNIPIYTSFGFTVTGEIKLPNGPMLWPMWRAPR